MGYIHIILYIKKGMMGQDDDGDGDGDGDDDDDCGL